MSKKELTEIRFLARGVGPLWDLGPDADEERITEPVAEHHDFGCGDVVNEEGHGSAQVSGFVSNFMQFKSRGCLSAKRGARHAQHLKDVGSGDESSFGAMESNGVDRAEIVSPGRGLEDALDLGSARSDGTEVQVRCLTLSLRVHLLSVLLVDDSEFCMFGLGEESPAVVRDNVVASCAEDEAIKVSAFLLFLAWLAFSARRSAWQKRRP